MPQSNFQDTFTKNESEQNLQYDDSAFYFFGSTLLTCIVVPWAIYLYSEYKTYSTINTRKIPVTITEHSKKVINEIKKRRKISTSFKLRLGFVIFLTYLLSICLKGAITSRNLKTFDPYEILSVDENATDKDIRSAFKRLAKIYHPDKNIGDPDAGQKFMLINKAYKCLENEEARSICLEFGNPDGKGVYQVGIALPSFLLKRENKLIVMAIFFIIILIVIPGIGLYYYQSSEKVDEFGTKKSLFYYALNFLKNENILFKNFIEIISVSEEMRPILSVKKEQMPHLAKLIDKEFIPKMGLDNFRAFLKPFYLLYAYMNGVKIHETLQDDLYHILKHSINILNSLFEISLEVYSLKEEHVRQLLGKPLKLEVIERLVQFTQHLYQGMWLHDAQIIQLPGVDRDNSNEFKLKMKKLDLKPYIKDQEMQTKLYTYLKDKPYHLKNLESALKSIANIEVNLKLLVKLENDALDTKIYAGDIFSIQIEIERKNPIIGYVHSKNLPFLKLENFIILILETTRNAIVFYKKVASLENKIVEEYTQFAFKPGKQSFRIVVMIDSYVGLDEEKIIEVEINVPVMQDEEYKIHPEDEKALKEETLLKSMLNDIKRDDVDSDEEIEDDDGAGPVEEDEEIKEEK